jgi:chorismate mutase
VSEFLINTSEPLYGPDPKADRIHELEAEVERLLEERKVLRAFIAKHKWDFEPPYDALTRGEEISGERATAIRRK